MYQNENKKVGIYINLSAKNRNLQTLIKITNLALIFDVVQIKYVTVIFFVKNSDQTF